MYICRFFPVEEEVENGHPKPRWDREVHKIYGRKPFSNQQRC